MNQHFFKIALLILSLASAAYSEDRIAVRTLALRADEMPELFLQTGEDFSPLRFSAVQAGEPLVVPAGETLPIFRESAEGEAGFAIVQRLKLPRNATGILLLGWQSGEQLRFVAVKDNFKDADFSDWLLVNGSTHAVAFRVGDAAKPLLVKPGVSCTHRVSVDEGKGTEVAAGAVLKGKARTFYSTFWPVSADKRHVVVFLDDGDRIRVKRINDTLVRKEQAVTVN